VESQPIQSDLLQDLGTAPELTNQVWLNTAQPLSLSDLRGSVVLLDMWTFGCINCQRVIPHLRSWHERYQDQGLVVIGNHYPEFEYERDLENLKQALVRLEIPYPVAQDNDRATWGAYGTRYWPTLYLIDKFGRIRYSHIGEGRYEEIEQAILVLLAERYP
jgi:thiol-disulfide isomerase/thioredoxin